MLYSNLRLKLFFTLETNWKYTKMVGFIKNSMNTKLQKVSLINKNLSFETIVILKNINYAAEK